MQTDELRSDLQAIADEMAPFDADLLGLHRRDERRHALLRVAAAFAAIVVVAVAIAFWRSQRDTGVSGDGKKERSLHQLRRVNVVVIPASGEVRDRLDRSPFVANYAPVGGLAASLGARLFPQLHAIACGLEKSPGFAVEGAPGSLNLEDDLAKTIGNGGQVFRVLKDADLEIFMNPDASESEIGQLRDALIADPNVASLRSINHVEAFNEFKRIFADQPDLITKTKPSELPASFRVSLHDRSRTEAVRVQYEGRKGVDTVVTFENVHSVDIFATDHTGFGCAAP
jgi:hypothetical protein